MATIRRPRSVPPDLFDDPWALEWPGLEVVEEHLSGAGWHAGEDALLGVLAGAAEREGDVLVVGVADNDLDRAVLEPDDVLEGEQQVANVGGELLVGLAEGRRARRARLNDRPG
jgi:hypothetical protein